MQTDLFENMKKEMANIAYIGDFSASDGSIIPDMSSYVYEHKYYLTTMAKIERFLGNKQQHIKEMKTLFRDCNIGYATCRFYFKGLNVSLDIQKELLKLQKEIYNDITVQMINGKFDDFKELFEFAKKLEMPITTLIDLKQRYEEDLIEYVKYIAEKKENINHTKWLYGKMDTWFRSYAIVRNAMKKIGIPKVLTGCYKRCSIENFKQIAVPIVAVGFFGFDASCMDYREKTEKNKGRFAPKTDVFDSVTWEYKKESLKNYRNVRLKNLKNINEAIENLNEQAINQRPRVQALFQKLVGLEAQ